MAEKGHTELPWRKDGEGLKAIIRGADATIVALRHRLPAVVHDENFDLIVTAVNTYPAVEGLVKALSELLDSSERHIFGDECKKEREAARSALSRFRSLQNGGAS